MDRGIERRRRTRRAISREDYVSNIRRQTERAKYRMRKGLMLVVLGVIVLSIAITYLFYGITIRDHRMYSELAANTQTIRYPIYPARGNIYSADGKNLAISTFTYTIGITPEVFRPSSSSSYTQAEVEEEFARILEIDLYSFREALAENKDATYYSVKQNISSEKNDELTAFLREARVNGVRQDANQARYYPQGDLASTIVGFAQKRDANISGVLGLESYYNTTLSGREGYFYAQVDNYWRQALSDSNQVNLPAEDGFDIHLTLQSDLQRLVQDLTREMVIAQGAENGGQITVMDARTGAILAMSGENNFDLNHPMAAPYHIDPEDWKPSENTEQLDYMTGTYWSNRTINYPFEIGSVMKPFVLGMTMDENEITADATVSDDFIYIDGWGEAISSYDNMSKGEISLAYAMWDSRNPPFVRMAQSIGIPTFYEYINRLGLRSQTGIDLPNERVGLIHENPKEIDMAVTAFGEQVTITGMQLINDYQMLANDGTLLRPYVVSEIKNQEGDVVDRHEIEVVREVFSEDTARQIREVLIGVGRYGTAYNSYIVGTEFAYKTGTSSRRSEGAEFDDRFTHTAVALVPADNPQYVILSSMHDIAERRARAAQLALRKLLEYLVQRDGIPVTYKAYDYNRIFTLRYAQDVLGMERSEAHKHLFMFGNYVELDEGFELGENVNSQYPLPGYNIGHDSTYWISDKSNALPEEKVILPDFVGLNVEEARNLAKRYKLNIAFTGNNRAGVITEQLVLNSEAADGKEAGDHVRIYTQVLASLTGDDQPGPREDDSLVYGMDNGSGVRHGS